jgi:hypothetical protein
MFRGVSSRRTILKDIRDASIYGRRSFNIARRARHHISVKLKWFHFGNISPL